MAFETLERVRRPSSDLQLLNTRDRRGSTNGLNELRNPPRNLRNTALRSLRLKKTPTSSGFLLNVDLPVGKDEDNGEEMADLNGIEAARGQRFANIFLNSAKSINAKYNVVVQPEAKSNGDLIKGGTLQKVKVSRASRNRAELVKATFEIKYHCLNLAVEKAETDPTYHSGVDGVYNPLQIIRNKIVRKSLNHQSPSLYRTLPLACNAFSAHSRDDVSWSMVWGVELNDYVADFAWRQLNWNKLRNAKGELWFPDEEVLTPHLAEAPKALHDKLWEPRDSEVVVKAEDILLKVPIMATRHQKTSKKIKKNIKEKAKRFYGSGSAESSVNENENTDSGSTPNNKLSSLESVSQVKIDRVVRRNSADYASITDSHNSHRRKSSDANINLSSEGEPSSEEHPPRGIPKIIVSDPLLSPSLVSSSAREKTQISPVLKAEDVFGKHLSSRDLGSVSDVSFSQVNLQRSSSKLPSSAGDYEAFDEASKEVTFEEVSSQEDSIAKEQDDDNFTNLASKVKFLEANYFLASYYLGTIYPQILSYAKLRTLKLHKNVIKELLHSAVRINDEILPSQENLYRGFLDETTTLIHLANDKHAVRIDNLLSATDRSYNELNTSLSMDLRKVSEQLEKLNLKFLGNSVTTVLRDAQGNVLANTRQYQALYFVLENIIVILLRLIWVSANIFKFIWIIIRSLLFIFVNLWRLIT